MKQRASLEEEKTTTPPTLTLLSLPSSSSSARRQQTYRKLPAFLRPPRDSVRYAAFFLDVNSRERLLCRSVSRGGGGGGGERGRG